MAGLGTPFFSVLNVPFISVHFWTKRSFPFIFRVFGDLWNPKEQFVHFRSFLMNRNEGSEQNVHFWWTEMNAVNETFIFNEREWTQWTKRSFKMNGNERRERTVQLQKELLNVSFIFCVHFWVGHFEPLLTQKGLFWGHFWGLLGPDLTKWTKCSFSMNGNERSERNLHFHWTEMNVENETFI